MPRPSVARYFYDCEFIEDGRTIDLVSIGVVAEDGREFYAVSAEFDAGRAGSWVRAHVLPQLPPPASPEWRSRSRIRDDLLDFFRAPGRPIELWAWCAAYDHVALAQLWGDMPALPRDIPRCTYEIRQHWMLAGQPRPRTVPQPPTRGTGQPPTRGTGPATDRHHALADAKLGFARWQAAEKALRSRRGA